MYFLYFSFFSYFFFHSLFRSEKSLVGQTEVGNSLHLGLHTHTHTLYVSLKRWLTVHCTFTEIQPKELFVLLQINTKKFM